MMSATVNKAAAPNKLEHEALEDHRPAAKVLLISSPQQEKYHEVEVRRSLWESSLVKDAGAASSEVKTQFRRPGHEDFVIRQLRSGRTGIRVWPSAIQLLNHSEELLHVHLPSRTSSDADATFGQNLKDHHRGIKRVALELGSGVGVVAVGLSRQSWNVIATDHDSATLKNLRYNIQTNRCRGGANAVEVRKLDWWAIEKARSAVLQLSSGSPDCVPNCSAEADHAGSTPDGAVAVSVTVKSSSSLGAAEKSFPQQQKDHDGKAIAHLEDDFLVANWLRDDLSECSSEDTAENTTEKSSPTNDARSTVERTISARSLLTTCASLSSIDDSALNTIRNADFSVGGPSPSTKTTSMAIIKPLLVDHPEINDKTLQDLEKLANEVDCVVGSDLLYEDTCKPLRAVIHSLLDFKENLSMFFVFQERTEGRVLEFAESLKRWTSTRTREKSLCDVEVEPAAGIVLEEKEVEVLCGPITEGSDCWKILVNPKM
ncbi:unnamed protein product [Amoebophrya sp. A120]|nr:unnamed protein product [Amoebophrya sp. A120]|eukprot:GSA120T00016960001.1